MRERGTPPPAPPSAPRIAAVDPLDRRGARVRLSLDDGTTLDLPGEVLALSGLGAGDALDEEDRARLVDDGVRWRIRDVALRLLGRRPRSRRELRTALLRRGLGGAAMDEGLDALEASGLVDDGAFARSFVRDRLRLRPRGRGRLERELRERGVDPETSARAIAEVFGEEGVREEALARQAALAWLRRQPPAARAALAAERASADRDRARRRLHAFLARRGFGGALSGPAVEAAAEAVRRPDGLPPPR